VLPTFATGAQGGCARRMWVASHWPPTGVVRDGRSLVLPAGRENGDSRGTGESSAAGSFENPAGYTRIVIGEHGRAAATPQYRTERRPCQRPKGLHVCLCSARSRLPDQTAFLFTTARLMIPSHFRAVTLLAHLPRELPDGPCRIPAGENRVTDFIAYAKGRTAAKTTILVVGTGTRRISAGEALLKRPPRPASGEMTPTFP